MAGEGAGQQGPDHDQAAHVPGRQVCFVIPCMHTIMLLVSSLASRAQCQSCTHRTAGNAQIQSAISGMQMQLFLPQRMDRFTCRIQRRLNAGAACENLKARCPYFFAAAKDVAELCAPPPSCTLLLKTPAFSFPDKRPLLRLRCHAIFDPRHVAFPGSLRS